MKVLFIGGTGLISSACSELVLQRGHELTLINRSSSTKYPAPDGAEIFHADVHADESSIEQFLARRHFDVVIDWIAYLPADVERDIRLFRGRMGQFIFISSASAYQKPPRHYLVTESTPLENPFWEYSRNKIACEQRLQEAYQAGSFPLTIVRPSLTYGPGQIPFSVGSWAHPWTVIDRMQRGREVVVAGDGTSLWVLTWNQDFARGLVGLFGDLRALGEAFHITSDEVLTWDQIHLEACRALALEPRLVHLSSEFIASFWPHAVGSLIGDKSNSVVFDNSKIKSFVPGFNCEVSWAGGIRRLIAWYDAHPQFKTIDDEFNALCDRMIAAQRSVMPVANP